MPSPEQTEVAESFARLAAIDLATAEKLAPDPEMDDRPVGFHAQQAVEKAVKAVLMLEGIDFPKTHDLEYLIVVAEEYSAALEPKIKSASWLTPLGRRVPVRRRADRDAGSQASDFCRQCCS